MTDQIVSVNQLNEEINEKTNKKIGVLNRYSTSLLDKLI